MFASRGEGLSLKYPGVGDFSQKNLGINEGFKHFCESMNAMKFQQKYFSSKNSSQFATLEAKTAGQLIGPMRTIIPMLKSE